MIGTGTENVPLPAVQASYNDSTKQDPPSSALGHGALPRPRSTSDGGGPIDRQRERQLVGSLTNNVKYRVGGLIKKVSRACLCRECFADLLLSDNVDHRQWLCSAYDLVLHDGGCDCRKAPDTLYHPRAGVAGDLTRLPAERELQVPANDRDWLRRHRSIQVREVTLRPTLR